MKKKVLSIIPAAAMALTLLTGCSGIARVETPYAEGGRSYNLVYQCSTGTGGNPFKCAELLSDTIEKTSGGRINMDTLATDSVVSTADMLDAVGNGTLDCIHMPAVNFADDAVSALSSLPAGMNYQDYMGWYFAGEGQKILDEVMAEIAPNVVAIPCGAVDSEILFCSKTPIKSLEDIKGLKIRGVSDWANIETILGASVVSMAGSECYEAISRGTIDAFEYSGPYTNWSAGFHEVAPCITVPGIHAPCAVFLFIVNKDVWNSLDETAQNIIRTSCQAMCTQTYVNDFYSNADAWKKFEELEEKGECTISYMSDEDLETIREVASDYYEKKCESNPLFAKIYNSQMEYLEQTRGWREAVS